MCCEPVVCLSLRISPYFCDFTLPRLDGNNLKGKIPTENGLLRTLRAFDLQDNLVSGPIPSELCNLRNLQELLLGGNQLSSTVPSCIEQLTDLRSLYLNDNKLEYELPEQLSKLHRLEHLTLSGNKELTGDPSAIFNRLKNLKTLLADKNAFIGKIDRKFLSGHTNLTWLDLSDNDFRTLESGLPTHMFKFPSLKVLNLSNNRFSSNLPTEIPENHVLEFLSLRGNSLVGEMPKELLNLKALRFLDLSNNYFHGGIRHELGAMSKLESLLLGDNPDLSSGNLPARFSNLTALQFLDVRNTNRNGSLPSFLGNLHNLVFLDLSRNAFQNDIPSSYGTHWKKMEVLMINANKNVTGHLPHGFTKLNKLRTILLDGTSIEGNVAETICFLPHFADMDGHEHAYADCGEDNPLFSCPCCECCTKKHHKDGCSSDYQTKLLAKWETDFQKMNFDTEPFLDRSYLPPN